MSDRKRPRAKKGKCQRCGYMRVLVRHKKCADCRFLLRSEVYSIQNAKRAKKRVKCTPEKSKSV